jgi:hypothetical protein
MKAANMKVFENYKDLFLEAFSAKLMQYEAGGVQSNQISLWGAAKDFDGKKPSYSINLNPRVSYGKFASPGNTEHPGNMSSPLQNPPPAMRDSQLSAIGTVSSKFIATDGLQNFRQPQSPPLVFDVGGVSGGRNSTGQRRGVSPPQNVESLRASSQTAGKSPAKTATSREEVFFNYSHDFDDGGVFYYLGSLGRARSWQNPHEIGQVNCFFSSLGQGSLGDLVGRSLVNCRTLNEVNSFMGVDLGFERYLVPTCYTLRNRNSSSHVLLNWTLEASVDGKDFYVIDRRVHWTDDEHLNNALAKEREILKERGATTTWGIDQNLVKRVLSTVEVNGLEVQGFRFFRLVQISKNSTGSDNLALSGFELYGVGQGTNWTFFRK